MEGVIDHHLLGLHHVREFVVYKAPWDYGFLAISVAIGLVGWMFTRKRGA